MSDFGEKIVDGVLCCLRKGEWVQYTPKAFTIALQAERAMREGATEERDELLKRLKGIKELADIERRPR